MRGWPFFQERVLKIGLQLVKDNPWAGSSKVKSSGMLLPVRRIPRKCALQYKDINYFTY